MFRISRLALSPLGLEKIVGACEPNVCRGLTYFGVLALPFVGSALYNMYWTRQFKILERNEILNDRFAWLYERFLDDEIDTLLLKQSKAL